MKFPLHDGSVARVRQVTRSLTRDTWQLRAAVTAVVFAALAGIASIYGPMLALQAGMIVVAGTIGRRVAMPRGSDGPGGVTVKPTSSAIVYCVAIAAMGLVSLNFGVETAGYVTCFVVGGAAASCRLAVRNLQGLQVGASSDSDLIFAGSHDAVALHVCFGNSGRDDCYAIDVRMQKWHRGPVQQVAVVPPGGSQTVQIDVEPPPRGVWEFPTLVAESTFPFGLFTVHRQLSLLRTLVVCPSPDFSVPPGIDVSGVEGVDDNASSGSGDVDGVRPYVAGDPVGRLAWREMARTDGRMLTKVYASTSGPRIMLSLAQVSGMSGLEPQLSRLCGWVLHLEEAGEVYGLSLHGQEIAPGRGAGHLQACLTALARHESQSVKGLV
jgi:uncharacterized protein (DUF58 family)